MSGADGKAGQTGKAGETYGITPETTRLGALKSLGEVFRAAGIETAQRDARLLMLDAAGLQHPDLIRAPREQLGGLVAAKLAGHVRRRLTREPVARILGEWEFWSLPFTLSPATLVPRPDSETVIEAVLATVGERSAPLRLLDFGTGSGCLLLALLSELPMASGLGVDLAPDAALTARRNASGLGLGARADFVAGDWATAIVGKFDVIVFNPPYIPSGTIALLAPEVAHHDPRRALDGGPDGLDCYRVLAPETARLLRKGGFAAFELGAGQAQPVLALMRDVGLTIIAIRRDLAGIERCLVARRD